MLAQHEGITRRPQFPAPLDAREVHSEAFGQTALFDSRFSRGGACNQGAQYSPDCIEQSTAGDSGEGRALKQHRQLAGRSSRYEKTRRGMTGKPRRRARKTIVLRRPLPMTSILLHQRRRYNLALSEARRNLQQQFAGCEQAHWSRDWQAGTWLRVEGWELPG